MAGKSSRSSLPAPVEWRRTVDGNHVRRHPPSSFGAVRAALVLSALLGLSGVPWPSHSVFAQTPVESSAEARFQLDVHVPDGAIAPMLPMGFVMNVATQGAAKD